MELKAGVTSAEHCLADGQLHGRLLKHKVARCRLMAPHFTHGLARAGL